MIEDIKKIARDSYTLNDYKYHILPVVKNALVLAEKLDADKNIIEVAAYLHDIGRAVDRIEYKRDNDHHIVGAEESRKILKKLGCEDDFIDKVYHCVLAHRGRKGPGPETLEAEIINCADAMAHFDTFLDLFYFILDNNSFEDAVRIARNKIDRSWNKKLTLKEAKKIIEDKYKAAMLLISSMEEYME